MQFLVAHVKYFKEVPFILIGNEINLFLPGIGVRTGYILSGMITLLIFLEWWLSKRWGIQGFLWAAMFTLSGGLWIGLRVDAHNLIFCTPILVLLFSTWIDRWQNYGISAVIVTILVFFAGGWFLYLSHTGSYAMHNALVLLLIPALLMIGLYWGRWWTVQSTKTWLEAYYSQENPPSR